MARTAMLLAGLEAIVGPPTFLYGSLLKSMEAEHTRSPDGNKEFLRSMSKPDKPKYATPAQEWMIVVTPKKGKK